MKTLTLIAIILSVQFLEAMPPWKQIDSETLSITIKVPTPMPVYQANTNYIDIGGAFFSSNEVESIVWKNNLGDLGECDFSNDSKHWYKNNVPIVEGTNIIDVKIIDENSNFASDFIAVLYDASGIVDTNPPTLNVIAPVDGLVTNFEVIDVYGTASDDSGYVAVTVNDELAGTNSWKRKVHLNMGTNSINVTAYDISSNITTKIVKVIFSKKIMDTNPPTLSVVSPADWTQITESNIAIYGTASDDSGIVTVKVNGHYSGTTNWFRDVRIGFGTNIVKITAMDPSHNITSNILHVIRINEKLKITTTSDELLGVLNETYIKKLETNQDDDDTDLWTIRGLPEETGLVPTKSGLIQGVPSVVGEISITAEVIDSLSGETTSTNLTINISSLNNTISLNNATVDGIVGQPYSAAIQVVGDNDNDYWNFNSTSDMPEGIKLSTNGFIEGMPSIPGLYSFNIIVTNKSNFPSGKDKKVVSGKIFFNIVDQENDGIIDMNVTKTTIKINRKKENDDKLIACFSFLPPNENFSLTNQNWMINIGNYPIPLIIVKTFKNAKGVKFYNSPDNKSQLYIKGKAIINHSGYVKVIVKVRNARLADAYNLKKNEKIPSVDYKPLQFVVGENSGHIILPMNGKTKNKIILKLRK